MNKSVWLKNELNRSNVKKSDLNINNQAKNFLDYLWRIWTLKDNTKKDLMETMNISVWLKKFLNVFKTNPINNNKSEIILMLSKLDENTLKQMKKIRLRNSKPKAYYLGEIKLMFGLNLDENDLDNLVTACRFYEKYKEYLTKNQANKTTFVTARLKCQY